VKVVKFIGIMSPVLGLIGGLTQRWLLSVEMGWWQSLFYTLLLVVGLGIAATVLYLAWLGGRMDADPGPWSEDQPFAVPGRFAGEDGEQS
jgi:hypothetical protein